MTYWRLAAWLAVVAILWAATEQTEARERGRPAALGARSGLSAGCSQIVANPQLDIVETGPGTGTAEPWIFLEAVIYFVKEEESSLAYDGYSLVLPDGDEGDATPRRDILGQIVQFPSGLTSATITYQRAMLDANAADRVYGELWRLTDEGEVEIGNPGTYRVTRWTVTDSNDAYKEEVIALDKGLLSQLDGQPIALLLRTETDGGGATEAEKEWVLFDDVTLTACGGEGGVFLPVIRRN